MSRKVRRLFFCPIGLIAAMIAVSCSGAGKKDAVISVSELAQDPQKFLTKEVTISGRAVFSDEKNLRFYLIDPDEQTGQPIKVPVSCTSSSKYEDIKEKAKSDPMQTAVIGGYVFEDHTIPKEPGAGQEIGVYIELTGIPGGKSRLFLLWFLPLPILGIGLALFFLLRKPAQQKDVEPNVYQDPGTVRKYAELGLIKQNQPVGFWYVSFDHAFSIPFVTSSDILIGPSGIDIGRDLPAMGLDSQTFPRKFAHLTFDSKERLFYLENLSRNLELIVAESEKTEPLFRIGPGYRAALPPSCIWIVDDNHFFRFKRTE